MFRVINPVNYQKKYIVYVQHFGEIEELVYQQAPCSGGSRRERVPLGPRRKTIKSANITVPFQIMLSSIPIPLIKLLFKDNHHGQEKHKEILFRTF